MATQYLKVRYNRRRQVYIDGERSGFTNKKLRVEEGPHVVDLGEPPNYDPPGWDVDLFDTSLGHPLEIEFIHIDATDGDGQDGDDAE